MKILIIGDIHTKHHIVDQILTLEENNYTHVVQAGDCFDAYDDTIEDNIATAHWFVEKINLPNWTILRSNHSVSYEFPWNKNLYCSGFTIEKSKAINAIVREHWGKQKTFHYANNFLFTHAGCSKLLIDLFAQQGAIEEETYSVDWILASLNKLNAKALEVCNLGFQHELFGAGWDRGGHQPVGGVLWIDFSSQVNIPSIKQICFHTPHIVPDIRYFNKKKNKNISQEVSSTQLECTKWDINDGVTFDLDTHLHHYAILEENKLTIYEVLFNASWRVTRKGAHIVTGSKPIYSLTL